MRSSFSVLYFGIAIYSFYRFNNCETKKKPLVNIILVNTVGKIHNKVY